MSHDLLIVQPYVPRYRQPLFDGVVSALGAQGITAQVAAPLQLRSLQGRGDATSGQAWRLQTHGRSVHTPWAEFSSYGSVLLQRKYRAVIVPAAASCLDAQIAVWRAGRRPRVCLWGHIGTYVSDANPLDQRIEGYMLRRADHVFAYTPSGAAEAVAAGVGEERVTTLMNTIDTAALEQAVRDVTPRDTQSFREKFGIENGAACYFGALDASKRIDLLAKALDVVWEIDRGFRLLVGGQGADAHLLAEATSRGQVQRLGHADATGKALAASVSNVIVNPGRVGLLAVDALVLRRPVLTTLNAHHAPEFEYLTEGRDVFSVADDPEVFADHLINRSAASTDAMSETAAPTLDAMVARFVSGVGQLLS